MPNPPRKQPQDVDQLRSKPVRERMQEAVNGNLVQMAQQGFKDIDRAKDHCVRKLKSYGITDTDNLLTEAATFLKRSILKGLSK